MSKCNEEGKYEKVVVQSLYLKFNLNTSEHYRMIIHYSFSRSRFFRNINRHKIKRVNRNICKTMLLWSCKSTIQDFWSWIFPEHLQIISCLSLHPAGNYMFKVNNRKIGTRCGICSRLTIKTPERRHPQNGQTQSMKLVSFWCLYC